MNIKQAIFIRISECRQCKQISFSQKEQLEHDILTQQLLEKLYKENTLMIPKQKIIVKSQDVGYLKLEGFGADKQYDKQMRIHIQCDHFKSKRNKQAVISLNVNIHKSQMSNQPYQLLEIQIQQRFTIKQVLMSLYDQQKYIKIPQDRLAIKSKSCTLTASVILAQIQHQGMVEIDLWDCIEQTLNNKELLVFLPQKQRQKLNYEQMEQSNKFLFDISVKFGPSKFEFQLQGSLRESLNDICPRIKTYYLHLYSNFFHVMRNSLDANMGLRDRKPEDFNLPLKSLNFKNKLQFEISKIF